MGDEQLAIFFLPLVAVRLYILVLQMGLQMGGLVKEHPEEKVGVEVAVDGNLVEGVVGTRPPVIPQFRHPLEGDMEMDFVKVQVIVYPVHSRNKMIHSLTVVLHLVRRQVVGQNAAVFLFCGQNEGQSQSLRLCLCILALLLQAPHIRLTTSSNAITLKMFFLFIFAITTNNNKYCA